MIFLRSLLFNICFFSWSLLASFIYLPFFIIAPQRVGHPWAAPTLALAQLICGIRHEIRGQQYFTRAPVIYAAKHQSAWDTVIFLTLLSRPAYVLKRELLWIPCWGWYLWRMKMIAIDRSAGASSMKSMIRQSQAALADGRPIVIYPEGTRTRPGAAPQYHPGVAALYSQLNVPVVPVALNSGMFWGKDAFIKRPGTIVLKFLPAIAPGLDKKEFMAKLEASIETASQKLLEEGK